MTVIKRGKVSSADLATIPLTPFGKTERVTPPHDLTDEEVEVWVRIVNNEPADWFSPSTVPLLTQYCRHVVEARRVAELKERALTEQNIVLYDRFIQAQARETAAIAMLAVKMRLAQQSTTNHRGNHKKPTSARKLWQD